MIREFVEVELFIKLWDAMELSDDDLSNLQEALLINPLAGALIKGSGGARKLRIAFQGKGKSRSGRVIYVDFAKNERTYLIIVYPKSKQGTLTEAQTKKVHDLIVELRKEEEHRRGKR